VRGVLTFVVVLTLATARIVGMWLLFRFFKRRKRKSPAVVQWRLTKRTLAARAATSVAPGFQIS
jgi:hypothetical protein